jgi:hypothetical protein
MSTQPAGGSATAARACTAGRFRRHHSGRRAAGNRGFVVCFHVLISFHHAVYIGEMLPRIIIRSHVTVWIKARRDGQDVNLHFTRYARHIDEMRYFYTLGRVRLTIQ